MSPNARIMDGIPLMHLAAGTVNLEDNTRVIDYLLSKGAWIDGDSTGGRTPLFINTEAGCLDIEGFTGASEINGLFLIAKGANVRVSAKPEGQKAKQHGVTHLLGLACT